MTFDQQYIIDRCIPIPEVGCWLWLYAIGPTGYGHCGTDREGTRKAHRVSYEVFKGPIPAGKLVQHSCDNPWCVNPDHLSVGTHATNNWDKQAKGRAAKKLTADDVARIRESEEPLTLLAARFGVGVSMIKKIRCGDNWVHVPARAASRRSRMSMVGACLAREMQRRGARVADIAHAFGTTPLYMQHILSRRRWTDWSKLLLDTSNPFIREDD